MIVSLAEVKAHLRIETDDEDEYLVGLIAKAQAIAENYCRVSFDDADTIDEPVCLAIMLLVSFYYENRDMPDRAVYNTTRAAFENLLYPYRDVSKMF